MQPWTECFTLTGRFLDVDGGDNALSPPDMGLGDFDEICAVLQHLRLGAIAARCHCHEESFNPVSGLRGLDGPSVPDFAHLARACSSVH